MKVFSHLWLIAAAIVLFVACDKDEITTVVADDNTSLELRASVMPEVVTNWKSGNAYFECTQAGSGCDFAWKVDAAAPNGDYHTNTTQYNNTPTSFDATIVITNSNGITFDWSSDYQVCTVIVKGGPQAHIYRYPEGSCGDTGLSAPINPNSGQLYGISHVSFCFDDTPCETPPNDCYQEETAWATGPRYTNKGNWATYTPYPGNEQSVAIFAGRTIYAGTATFKDNGNGTVDISINLDNTFIFYYDPNNQMADENIKVQDYALPPSGNPAPGLFAHKATIAVGTTTYIITVPLNNYYGIHLDVARAVDCE